MTFRTTFDTGRAPFRLDPSAGGLVMLGSCFTTEMGERLLARGYAALPNPCGVQYNPASISRLLRAAMAGDIDQALFFLHEGRYRCWLMPTRFSSPQREEAENICHTALHALRRGVLEADALTVTLGTARAYFRASEGVVANCHKVPAGEFESRRLSVEEIAADWVALLDELARFRPGLKVIFTVSPIRHFKDGAHENTLSKATLHLAIEKIMEKGAGSGLRLDYFPAWELLMDDLRDYRFYAADMLHPSPVAGDYIWQAFEARYFDSATRQAMAASLRLSRRNAHRPLLE